jgi:hypothetical protein
MVGSLFCLLQLRSESAALVCMSMTVHGTERALVEYSRHAGDRQVFVASGGTAFRQLPRVSGLPCSQLLASGRLHHGHAGKPLSSSDLYIAHITVLTNALFDSPLRTVTAIRIHWLDWLGGGCCWSWDTLFAGLPEYCAAHGAITPRPHPLSAETLQPGSACCAHSHTENGAAVAVRSCGEAPRLELCWTLGRRSVRVCVQSWP